MFIFKCTWLYVSWGIWVDLFIYLFVLNGEISCILYKQKRGMNVFIRLHILENLGSQNLVTHTPLDIRHSQGTRCLVRIEGDELCKRQKAKWINRRHIQEGNSFNNISVLEVATSPQVLHRVQSVLNSIFLLSKEIPDPPQ